MVKDINKAVMKAVKRLGTEVLREAEEKCPVRTGRLRDSISLRTDGNGAVIYTDVEYAAAVELGTVLQRPQPYLSYAIHKAEGKAAEIFKEELL